MCKSEYDADSASPPKCLKVVEKVGEACNTNSKCPKESTCEESKCKCKSDYVSTLSNNAYCYPKMNTEMLDGNCNDTIKCHPMHSMCNTSGQCVCDERIAIRNGAMCDPIVPSVKQKLEGACKFNETCMDNMECKSDKCACKPGYNIVEAIPAGMTMAMKICLPKNKYTEGIAEKAMCDLINGPDFKVCKKEYACIQCPETNSTTCLKPVPDTSGSNVNLFILSNILAMVLVSLIL
jgi:hypothetical protein